MQNVSVNAAGGYAGVQGAPATETWVNIDVNGGQYGMIIDIACGANGVAGLTLENQTTAGLKIAACGATSINGFKIQENSIPAIVLSQSVAQLSSLSLVDGSISVTGGTQPAISNPQDLSLYFNNTYIQAPQKLIANSSSSIAASGHMDLLTEYAHVDHGTNNIVGGKVPDGTPIVGYNVSVVNNTHVTSQADVGSPLTNRTPPSDLVIRHLPGQLPWINDTNVVWATDFGADPTGKTDSTTAIRSAIAASLNKGDEVFLPRGVYSITGTLQLNPNTKFFGVPGQFSGLNGYSWVTNGKFMPFVASANSLYGKTLMSDININLPTDDNIEVEKCSTMSNCHLFPADFNYSPLDNTYLSALLWQTGRSSVLNQVSVTMEYQNAPNGSYQASAARKLIDVENNGGGRWYGLQEQFIGGNSTRGNNPDFRELLVSGTREPLTLYGSNPEHLGPVFYEFSNAANIRVLGMKTECGVNLVEIDNGSANILIMGGLGNNGSPGGTGSQTFLVSKSSDVTISTMSYYGHSSNLDGNLITDGAGTILSADAIGMYKNGSYNAGAFPYCGDGICDGGETATNCPVDCRGGGAPVPTPTPKPVTSPTPKPVASPTPKPVASPTPIPVLSGPTVSPSSPSPGQTVTVKGTFKATTSATNATLYIWLVSSAGHDYGSTSTKLNLTANVAVPFTITMTLPATLPAGSYFFSSGAYNGATPMKPFITDLLNFQVK